MARNGTNLEQKLEWMRDKHSTTQPAPVQTGFAEREARRSIEEQLHRPIGDKEWKHWRHRLMEFILTLARWDSAPHP